MSIFILNKIIVCDNWDLPWMIRHIKNLILYKNNFLKTFVRGKSSMFHLLTFNNLQNYLNQSIQKSKQNYLNKVDKRPSDPSTSTICYWSLLKNILNNKKYYVFHLYFTITSILLILKKRVKYSTPFLLNSVPPYLTKVYYQHI